MERWRQPAKIVAVDEDASRIYHDGNVYRKQVDMTLTPDTLARMKLGYICLRCLEPQEESMPGECALCGYGMQEFQLRDLAKEFAGTKHIGPSTTIDEEVDRLREAKARERLGLDESLLWTPPGASS